MVQPPLNPFEALVLASPDFIAVADLDGTVTFLNPAGRRMLGVPDDGDPVGTSLADHLTQEAGRARFTVDRRPGGRWVGRSTLRRWGDGALLDVDVSTYVVDDPTTGDPVSLVTVLRDARSALAGEYALASALARLDEAEKRHRTVLKHMSDILVVLDADGDVVYASASASVLAGLPDELFRLHAAVLDGTSQRGGEDLLGQLTSVFETPGHHETVRMRLRTRDGVLRTFEANAENVLDDPKLAGVIVMLRDVTERDRAEQALAGQTRVLEMVAGGEPLDRTLDALARTIEQERPDLSCAVLLVEHDDDAPWLRLVTAPAVPPAYRHVIDGLPVDGGTAPCSRVAATGRPVLLGDLEQEPSLRQLSVDTGLACCWAFPVASPGSGDVVGVVALYGTRPGLPGAETTALIERAVRLAGIAVDRSRIAVQLAHEATHDELTGLPNRTLLLDRLRLAVARRPAPDEPVTAVLFIDLDRLKVINDSLGHDVGDELLKAVAHRLTSVVRPADTVSRFGGDEFVVMADESEDGASPDQLAERVVRALAAPLVVDGRTLSTAASVGVVLTAGYTSGTDVLRDADTAMYRAKGAGGNRFELFDPSMRDRALARLELEHAIRTGLDRDEFEVVYQPVVDLAGPGQAVAGFEALVRWRHPERGLLYPEAFIDVAEETGLIVPLGDMVLRTASRTVGSWAVSGGRQLGLSVNVSMRQLTAPGLVSAVTEAMAVALPWTLFLELTEKTLLADAADARAVIDALAGVGAELCIDDFGTGYSSLSHLTRLPVTTLKIDRSVVSQVGAHPEAEAVAAAIIGLADRLGQRVVATGVETEAQADGLTELGCRYAQGFWFHPPLEAEQARVLVEV